MNQEEREAIADYIVATCDAYRKIIETGDHLINVLGKPILEAGAKTEKPSLEEISSLRYVDKTSDKGPYKTASLANNPENPAFLKLQKYLEDHKGFAILHGFKFWTFSNNQDVLGRRKQ